jgi:hypothetical protein
LLFCSLALVVGSLVLFVWSARQGDCHESDRLCLMPLEDDTEARPEPPVPSSPVESR